MSLQMVPPKLKKVADDAFERLQQHLVSTAFNLHLQTEPISAGSELMVDRKLMTIGRDTYLVFADELPEANWGHPCRYLLYDATTLELYQEIEAEFPPERLKTSPTSIAFHEPVVFSPSERVWSIQPESLPLYKPSSHKRYALLFAGRANARHVNDLEFLYRALLDVYDVPHDQIYVLNYDGSISADDSGGPMKQWPGDGTAFRLQLYGAGTKDQFDRVIDRLRQELQPNDSLLLHTNGHGGHGAFLCAYKDEDLWANYVQDKLNTLPPFRCFIAMMEQCYSGGFVNSIVLNTSAQFKSIATACNESQQSYGAGNFNPFAYNWIAAMYGAMADGKPLSANPDTDANGRVNAREAYLFANARKHPQDTPIFQPNVPDAESCYLGTSWSNQPMYENLGWVHSLIESKLLGQNPATARLKIKKLHTRISDLTKGGSESFAVLTEDKVNELLSAV